MRAAELWYTIFMSVEKKRKSHRHIRGIRILHEDADVIVVEKAAGVLSQATRCGASARMREHTVEDAL